jgi:SSS family transporter
VQVLLFSILAVEIKRKAPKSHTVLEIIHARWGTAAHLVFMFFCFATNLIVTAMLILGGATVINALTGVNVYAAAFLIPVSTILYTAHGGLKATFLAGWAHVAIIYAALCVFMFKVYAHDHQLGSPGRVWERLGVIQQLYPVSGNKDGSYLTMISESGVIFGIINIIGNFGTVFVDQSYWQSAIAAKPSATYKGYLLGGLCWFAIPFSMATTLGLAARAYNLPLTLDESNFGLVAPAVAVHTLGGSGAFLITLQLFMAVTSSAAAEQIAVSTLLSFDIFRRYLKPDATTRQLIRVSRIGVVFYGVFSGVLAIILFRLEISLGWLYLAMGNFIGSAVFPIAFSITWEKCSALGAIAGAIGGLVCSILAWVNACSKLNDGIVTVDTLGQNLPMLAGNITALAISPLICVTISMLRPQNYDWEVMKSVCGQAPKSKNGKQECSTSVRGKSVIIVAGVEMTDDEQSPSAPTDQNVPNGGSIHATTDNPDTLDTTKPSPKANEEDDEEALKQVLRWTYRTGGSLTVVLVILWPCLTIPVGVFPRGYFTFWVSLAIIWGLVASIICVFLPVWDARKVLVTIFFSVFGKVIAVGESEDVELVDVFNSRTAE